MKITLKEIAKKFDCNINELEIVEENIIELSEADKGDVVIIAGIEWIVFNHLENGTTQLVSKSFVKEDAMFDSKSNNYAESEIRTWLNTEFYNELIKRIGKEDIVAHTVDLTTLDGRKDYGKCNDFVSMPSFEFVRDNIDVFDRFRENIDDWQWTTTAYSTPETSWGKAVCCLLPVGHVRRNHCLSHLGVRAFCTFKSSISVSKNN